MMKHSFAFLFAFLGLLIQACMSGTQSIDLSGTWNFTLDREGSVKPTDEMPETGSKYGRRFLTGLNYNSRGIPVITSNGLGTSRRNIRTGARSDVVVVTLRRAAMDK